MRSREAWGAAPPVQPYVPQTPKGVSLHHTGAFWNGRPGPEQYLRNIQAFHTGAEREWEDIAYHYLVDLEGVIWAGRPPTVRGNPSIYYDPTGLVLISFLGDFESQEPTETQLASSADVAAWLMKKYNIPHDGAHRPPRPRPDDLPRRQPVPHLAGRVVRGAGTGQPGEALSVERRDPFQTRGETVNRRAWSA